MKKLLIVTVAIAGLLVLAGTIAVYWLFAGDGIRRTLEEQATAWLGQPVRIGQVRARIFPRAAIDLSDVRLGEPASVTLADVRLGTNLRALFSRRVEDATLIISDSRINMPLPFDLPEGGASEGTDASGGGIKVVSVRQIRLDDVAIVSRRREVVVSADAALEGDHFTLRRFTASSGKTSLRAEGQIDLEPAVDAKLKATADKIDLDELLALADAFTPEETSSSRGSKSKPVKIAAQFNAASAVAGGLEVSNLSATAAVEGERVSLSPLTFEMFGGRYEGSLSARLGDRISMTLQSRLKDIDVAKLAAFGGSPDTVTGTLSGTGTFSARGADMASMLANATGKGSASIVDGTIRGLNLVRTVVLFFGRPAPDSGSSSDHFDRFEATFSLAEQVFRADSISMHSSDADLTGSGSLMLADQSLDGRLSLTLSEELSAQAGTDLIRYTHEGNRVVLPARLGGTLSKPRLTIDAAAAIERGLKNELERRFKGLFGR